jgi:hypothetical protein
MANEMITKAQQFYARHSSEYEFENSLLTYNAAYKLAAEFAKQIRDEAIIEAKKALEHYADSNHWACEVFDQDHSGKCSQKLYRGAIGTGYDIAQAALKVLEGEC